MADPTAPGGLNWDDILEEQEESDSEFAALPAQTYTVEVAEAEAKVAQSGNQMIKLTCRVQGGPYNGRLLWTNIVFATANPTAMKFTLKKLRALGVSKEWLARENPNTATIASKLEGVVAEAEVEQKPYNGDMTNEIKAFKSITGATPTAAAPSPAAPAAASPEPKAPSTPTTASDIPKPDIDPEEPF